MKNTWIHTLHKHWHSIVFLFVLFSSGQLGYSQVLTVDILSDTIYHCQGTGGTILQTDITGGQAPYSINWSPSITLNNDTIEDPTADPIQSTYYTVLVTDSLATVALDSVFVFVLPTPMIAVSQVFDQCFTGNQFTFTLQDTSGIDSIIWNFGSSATPSSSTSLNPPAVQYSSPGNKTITVVAFKGGCISNTDSASFFVSAPMVDIGADSVACSGDSLIFVGTDISSAAGNILSWQWLFSNGVSLAGQTVQTSFLSAGIYTVTLNAIDSYGCTAVNDFQFVVEDSPTVDFSYTINDCNEVTFTNLSSVGAYNWDFGDGTTSTLANPVHTYQSPGVYFVMLTVSGNCQSASLPLPVTIFPACVWPGDANNDLIANNIDLLSIGIAYGSSGPVRNDSSLLWEGQGADNWNDTLLGGTNYVYVDTDGNGTVNDDDTLAINLNYGQTHNKKTEEFESGIVLYFDTTQVTGPIMVGTDFEIPVMLGTSINPADSVYGIAFTICYSNEMVDSASAQLKVDSSWLGMDLLRIERDFYLDGELDGGICRKNQVGVSNHGKIAQAAFVMVDDIAKQAIYDTLRLGFKDVVLIRADGSQIPVVGIPTKVVVFQDDLISGVSPAIGGPQLSLFPNPANDQFTVKLSQALTCRAELLDSRGKTVHYQPTFIGQSMIQTSDLAPGIYLLRIIHAGGIISKKVQIQR